jgi:hypothetical protein
MTCKSFYRLYDQWILSTFGGRHEIYLNLLLKAPSLLTFERICRLTERGIPMSRRFAQSIAESPFCEIEEKCRLKIVSAYAFNLWPSEHLGNGDTDVWNHCTNGDVTPSKISTLRTLINEYHYYPSPSDHNVGKQLAHIITKMPECIDVCQHILDNKRWQIETLDYIFRQIESDTLKPDEITNAMSYLTSKTFGETLVQAFIENASIEGIRGFLKSSSNLSLDFSLENLVREFICNDGFFYNSIPKVFWDKCVCLYKAFPCPEALRNHLVKLEIIEDPQHPSLTRCISTRSHDFLGEVSHGGMYVEKSFFKVQYINL